MRRIIFITLVFCIALCGLAKFALSSSSASPRDPSLVSDFAFTDRAGQDHHLYDFHDKTIIVHFWASWCGPCVEELPVLVRYAQTHPDTTLIAFSDDGDIETMNAFLQQNHLLNIPHVLYAWDERGMLGTQRFGVDAYPQSFVLNEHHQAKLHVEGAMDWNSFTPKAE